MDNEEVIFYAELESWGVKREPVETGHDRLPADRLTGQLQAIFVLRQPLHVGSGALEPPAHLGLEARFPLVKSFFRANQNLRIPGTSLKGVFRSLVEMITDSCAPASGKDACRFRDSNSRLCPACRIFGAMGYQGLVRFEDGKFYKGWKHAIQEIPPQYQPRRHPGWRRYYPHRLIERRPPTWPLEVILPGAQFLLTAGFENLAPGDLGLVLIALGAGEWKLCPKVGAGKNSGLGAIQMQELSVQAIDVRRTYQQFQTIWKEVPVKSLIEAAQAEIQDEALQSLQQDLGCAALSKEA